MSAKNLFRLLRGWHQEFMRGWLRLTGFHRMVLGLLLSLGLIYAVQTKRLDPLKKKVDALRQELQDQSVPVVVGTAEQDAQVQASLRKAETYDEQIKVLQRSVRAAEKTTHLRLDASQAEARAWVVECATKNGLRICENRAVERGSFFEMQGRFESVYRLLGALDQAPFIWRVHELAIALEGLDQKKGEELVNVPPLLRLRFILQLQTYRREGR
jgi:preprotein translocase subunit SecD